MLPLNLRELPMSSYQYRGYEEQPLVPPVILNLLIANGVFFLIQTLLPGERGGWILMKWLALWPINGAQGVPDFFPWQIVSYGFLHGNIAHIFFNMLALWMFGREIELRWGSRRFLLYYLVCVAGAGLIQLVVATITYSTSGYPYPTIGASGGTYGILLAYGMLFPYREVMLLFPPIPMQARFFVIVFGVLELMFAVSGTSPQIAHFAHLGGMLFGFILILYWRGALPIRPKRLPPL